MRLSNAELDEVLSLGGLVLAQPYAKDEKYRKDGYLFTRCKTCGTEADYRLKYILHKNEIGEQVCRCCFWLDWYKGEPDYSSLSEVFPKSSKRKTLSIPEAEELARKAGFELIELKHGSKPGDDVMVVKCLYCERQIAATPRDVIAGCSCKGRWTKPTNKVESLSKVCKSDFMDNAEAEKCYPVTENQKMSAREFKSSDQLAYFDVLSWWNFQLNDNKQLFKLTPRSKTVVNAYCGECGNPIKKPIKDLLDSGTRKFIGRCDECIETAQSQFREEIDQLSSTPVSNIEDLLVHWDDEHDPNDVMVFTYRTYKWKCDSGHHPNQTPYSFYKSGCSVCKGLNTKVENKIQNKNQRIPSIVPPELCDQWHPINNKKYEFGRASFGESRRIWWKCDHCGHEWQESLRDRLRKRSYGAWDCSHKPYYRCPKCVGTLDSLGWHYPSLAKEWSARNPVSAWDISPSSSIIDFTPEWVCSQDSNHIWTMPLASRIAGAACPQCREVGKSKIEIMYYKKVLKRWGSLFAIKSGAILRDTSFSYPWRIDILMIGALNIALEYDGAYWHKDKESTDIRKTKELLSVGYIVVRLREEGLHLLNINHPKYFELTVNNKGTDVDFILKRLESLLSLSKL